MLCCGGVLGIVACWVTFLASTLYRELGATPHPVVTAEGVSRPGPDKGRRGSTWVCKDPVLAGPEPEHLLHFLLLPHCGQWPNAPSWCAALSRLRATELGAFSLWAGKHGAAMGLPVFSALDQKHFHEASGLGGLRAS